MVLGCKSSPRLLISAHPIAFTAGAAIIARDTDADNHNDLLRRQSLEQPITDVPSQVSLPSFSLSRLTRLALTDLL